MQSAKNRLEMAVSSESSSPLPTTARAQTAGHTPPGPAEDQGTHREVETWRTAGQRRHLGSSPPNGGSREGLGPRQAGLALSARNDVEMCASSSANLGKTPGWA